MFCSKNILSLTITILLFCGCGSKNNSPEEFLPSLYDCSSTAELPDRISPVPLNCVIDPECQGEKMVVAHRGAGGEFGTIAPEDSLSAIRAALYLGVDGIELDARHTADGKLIVMHDGNMKRTTGVDANVSDLTFAEVTSTQLLAPSERYAGDFSCDRVPSLEEALLLAKDKLFVDLDTKTDRIDLVVDAIVNAGMIDQVFVSVSDVNKAIEARNLNPAIRIQVRPDTVDDASKYLSYFSRPPEIFEIPWSIGIDVRNIVKNNSKLFSDVFTEDIQTAGKGLSGDRDASHYQQVIDRNIEILQTEFPAVLLEYLGRWNYSTDPWEMLPKM
jgi:glycerophosphoryl diester phosphodiesterase